MRKMGGRFLWGMVAGVAVLGLALLVSLWAYSNSVLYWMLDTKYAVWYFAIAGGMLGLLTSTISTKIKSALEGTGAFEKLQLIEVYQKLSLPVKAREGKNGK